MINKRKTNEKQIFKQMKMMDVQSEDGVFIFTNPLTINEFATQINKSANEIITFFFKQGKMFNINHSLNEEQIKKLCSEFKLEFRKETSVNASNFMEEIEIIDHKQELVKRPPIITIMGHIDHGKTTLIDKIRKSNITANEVGGITQHIGAYQVEYKKKKITFLDTPGHEAFTKMRLCGAKVTDIIVLVIAANDGVMPQTKEAIDHAQIANVPIIVFVNKMDILETNIEKIKGDLSKINVIADDWGGDTQFVYGSALKEEGIDKLFEAINLQAEILNLTANPNRLAIGTVIESQISVGKGVTTTLIIQNGSLYKRDFVVVGHQYGHIRMMKDFANKDIEIALPSFPIIVTGLKNIPNVGDKFFGLKNEKFAKNLANKKAVVDKQQALKTQSVLHIEDGVKTLNIIVKSDVQGTAEAIKYSLTQIKNEEVKINIIRISIGVISKSDILLAQAAKAIILSFNIRTTKEMKQFAKQEKIEIKNYFVIYKIIEEVKALIKGMMTPKFEEQIIGEAKIIKVIFSSKIGNIAGSIVTSGYIQTKSKIKLIRDDKIIYISKLDSLQIGPNQVQKVDNGKEFGCHIDKFNDIKTSDIIEAYVNMEVK